MKKLKTKIIIHIQLCIGIAVSLLSRLSLVKSTAASKAAYFAFYVLHFIYSSCLQDNACVKKTSYQNQLGDIKN